MANKTKEVSEIFFHFFMLGNKIKHLNITKSVSTIPEGLKFETRNICCNFNE
jgi:hypothetical protein